MVEETDYKYDVFISYSSKDQEWVRGELLERIESAGLTAFIDHRDFKPGALNVKECKRGVVESRKTLVVITPDYIESEWCEFEAVMVQTLGPANRDLRLIPLLKTKSDKPLDIDVYNHIDFTDGADLDLAWRQLLTALGRPPEPPKPKAPKRDNWCFAHTYPMPPNFTGRISERRMLSEWLNADEAHPLLSLRALGGFGKSALVWHWLMNDVKPTDWPRVVWWSFYESEASFDRFIARTLGYISGEEVTSATTTANDIEALVDELHKTGTLLVLDGFERELRAFAGLNAAYQGDGDKPKENDTDCISPLAETFLRRVSTLPNIRSKVMLTTRLCPSILETTGGQFLQGCCEEVLLQMQPDDAVAYFRARGIRGARAEIEQVCEPYGYHPLSLSLVAGVVVKSLQQPGDIAVAKELDVAGDLVARQHHVLEVAYDSLTLERRALLSRIACFRSPVTFETLEAVAVEAGESTVTLESDLQDLVARGLLHHDTEKKQFDLHPIVRRYAYDRLGKLERNDAHTKLRSYFAAVPTPSEVTTLEELNPVIELYHHTVRAGQFDEARALYRDRLADPIYFQFGAYQLEIDLLCALFPDGDDRPPCLTDDSAQGWVLGALANSYGLTGQPRRAASLFQQDIAICERQDDKGNLATVLVNVAHRHRELGALQAADTSLRRGIDICREITDEGKEGTGLYELGRVLAIRGQWSESSDVLKASEVIKKRDEHLQAQGVICAYRALRDLLRLRSESDSVNYSSQSALESAQRALKLADEWQIQVGRPNARDYVRAHWLLGAAHRVVGQLDEAEGHLHEALERCRRINMVDHEADILIDLARLCAATGDPKEAKRLAEEALLITKRSGYVLQGADAHLELAKLARDSGDKKTALEHAQKARKLAYCDGPPDYTYHAAYTEAGRLLEELGE